MNNNFLKAIDCKIIIKLKLEKFLDMRKLRIINYINYNFKNECNIASQNK